MAEKNAKPTFQPQHEKKIEELVAIAKEQGYLTYEEINEILPQSFDSPEQIDQILIFLSGLDIQILNQAEVDRQKRSKTCGSSSGAMPGPWSRTVSSPPYRLTSTVPCGGDNRT